MILTYKLHQICSLGSVRWGVVQRVILWISENLCHVKVLTLGPKHYLFNFKYLNGMCEQTHAGQNTFQPTLACGI